MKPLTPTALKKLLKRFDSFKGNEICSLTIISPLEIELELTAQDSARAFDWVKVRFLFQGVSDARLVDASKLAYLESSEGVCITYAENAYYFCLGSYTPASYRDAQLYIVAQSIKYDESSF